MRYDNKKLKIIGYQYPDIIAGYEDIIKEIYDTSLKEESSLIEKLSYSTIDGFILGYIAGKRAERKRRHNK